MKTFSTLVVASVGLLSIVQPLHAQERARYRDYRLGGNVESVAALAGAAATDAKTIHTRPALMQELQWRRGYVLGDSTSPQRDPVEAIVFSFYNDQLSRLVVDYDRQRTAGMTDHDMIEALSVEYGEPVKAAGRSRVATSAIEQESGTPVARWGNADYEVVLFRSSYAAGFRVVVTSPRLEALAHTADAQAIRLDEREAPQREIARQKRDSDETRTAEDKARAANKAGFRP